MATLNNANVRGVLLTSKQRETDIFQYLILIDQPKSNLINWATGFMPQPVVGDNATTFSYQYSGTLVDPLPGEEVDTYMLPVFYSKQLAAPNGDNLTVIITDSLQNSASGTPNKGRPPVIKFMDRGGNFTAATGMVRSDTNHSNYFPICMVNTFPNGGFQKLFQSSGPDGSGNLMFTLNPLSGKQALLVVGAFAASKDQYAGAYIKNPNDDSTTGPFPFDYNDYTPL